MSPEKKSINWQTQNVDLPEESVEDISPVNEKSFLRFNLKSLGRIKKSASLYENPETTEFNGQKTSRSEQQEISGYPGRFNLELPGKRSNSSDNLDLDQLGSFSFGLPGKRSLLLDQDQLDKLGRFSFGQLGKRSIPSEQDDLDKIGRFSFGMQGKRSIQSEQNELDQLGRFRFGMPGKRSSKSEQDELDKLGRFSFGLPGKRSIQSEQDELDQLGRFSFGMPGKRSSKSEQDELNKLGTFSFGLPGKRSSKSEQDELDKLGRFSFGLPGKRSIQSEQNEKDQLGRFSFGIPEKIIITSELQDQSKNSEARGLKSKKKYLENIDFQLGKRNFPNEAENNINTPTGSKFGQPNNNQKSCEHLMTKIVFLLKEAQYSKRPWIKEIGRIGKRDPNLLSTVTADPTNTSNHLESQQDSRPKKFKNSRVQPFFR